MLALNPLVLVIEQSRRVLVQGMPPSTTYLLLGSGLMLGLCELSFRLFKRSEDLPMCSDLALEVEQLSKLYPIYDHPRTGCCKPGVNANNCFDRSGPYKA